MSFLVPGSIKDPQLLGGWSLIPPLLGILLMNGLMKKTLRNWVTSDLTWEDKDIPNLVAQIGGPAPEGANAISLQQPDGSVLWRGGCLYQLRHVPSKP